MSLEKVLTADAVPPGRVEVVDVEGQAIAVCNVDGQFYAIDDVCTHDGGPLDQGELMGNEIECPRHGARFDVRTGRPLTLPAVIPVHTYQIEVRDGDVYVDPDS
ncbi:MAG TPA: non-heme iron oxygenase ferredoxin subunit [Dehalococcoidia bacterium]|nr:non-heme iron oxygenase ferredoxin subunit [Dehalococcoidia bacterium]